MRAMQVERGKTRPQTLMTGHTGYITHARKILKLPVQPALEPTHIPELPEEEQSNTGEKQETVEEVSELD